jgi:Flp pilus assembly secretin CpaC
MVARLKRAEKCLHPCVVVVALVALLLAAVFPPVSASGRGKPSAQEPVAAPASGASDAPTPAKDLKKAKQAYAEGKKAEKVQDWQAAYEAYASASNLDRHNREYRVLRDLVRSKLVQRYVDEAERDAVSGRMDEAKHEIGVAMSLDPGDPILRERLNELSQPTAPQVREFSTEPGGQVHLDLKPGTRSFDLRGNTQMVYEAVAKEFGVEVSFDVDLQPRPVRLQVADVDFPSAMRILGDLTGTFWRPLTRRLFFVALDTEQKRREYGLSVVRTIVLPASVTPSEMTEILRLVRDIAGITRTELDTNSRTITLRASPQAVRLASNVVENLEQPRGEVVLEFEILEVDRNLASQLGITPPQSSTIYTLNAQEIQQAQTGLAGLVGVLTQVFGTPSSLAGLSASQIAGLVSGGQVGAGSLVPPLIAFGGGKTTTLATLPGAAANFSQALSLVRTGQRIVLRAEDNQPATFFVGERYPVDMGQYGSSFGTGISVPAVSTSSFPTSNFATGNGPVAVATGMFDTNNTADGQDLAVVNQTDQTVSVLINNGNGTNFTPASSTPPKTGNVPSAIVAGQFDPNNTNDHTDLAVTNYNCSGSPLTCGSGSLTILLANGDGTFTPTSTPPATGKGPIAIATGQFNLKNSADHTDLAVVNQVDNTVSILLSNGDGTFTQAPSSPIQVGSKPSGIAVGDFNGDGFPDLAVTNENANTVSIFLGNGDGTFTQPTGSPYATGNAPVAVGTTDFTGDTFLDLAVVNFTDNTVSILLGNGDGTFQPQTAFTTGEGPTSLAIADYNVDGRPDIAVTDSTADAVSVLLNLGGGQFAPQFNLPVGTDPVACATADFGNSLPDLAAVNNQSNTVSVILNSTSFVGSNVTAGLTPYPNAEYIDLGVKVKATPRVHPSGDVSVHLEFEIHSLSGQSINNIPILGNRTIEQQVRVRDNDTAILAGMLDREGTSSVSGVPGLGDVDLLGFLTSSRTTQNEDTELLFLITPHVLRSPAKDSKLFYAGHEPSGGVEGDLSERRRPGEGFIRRMPEGNELPVQVNPSPENPPNPPPPPDPPN